MLESSSAVEVNAKLLLLSDCAREVFVTPLCVFTDQFDIAVPGLRDLFQALLERLVAKDGPEHYRKTVGSFPSNPGFSLRKAGGKRACDNWGEQTTPEPLRKCSTVHTS